MVNFDVLRKKKRAELSGIAVVVFFLVMVAGIIIAVLSFNHFLFPIVNNELRDLDGDGYYSDQGRRGDDCNDSDPNIGPNATEICDGIDNNCDGVIDEGCPCTEGETRACGLSIGSCEQGVERCDGFGNWGVCVGAILPGFEICGDGIDSNCDGLDPVCGGGGGSGGGGDSGPTCDDGTCDFGETFLSCPGDCEELIFLTEALPDGVSNNLYNETLEVSGGAAPYAWSLVGVLPSNMTLGLATGIMVGTPNETGEFIFNITVTDSKSQTDAGEFNITINDESTPTITDVGLKDGDIEDVYSDFVSVAGGESPYTWFLELGSLPSGLSLNSATGEISGTPDIGTVGGQVSTFTVRVQDGNLKEDSQEFDLTVYDTTCGNGQVDDGEVCDGVDLSGETCSSQNFDLGDLSCREDCSDYDTSGCSIVEPCDLTNAYWSDSYVMNNTLVTLFLEGDNCEGEAILVELWEDDFDVWPFEDDFVDSFNLVFGDLEWWAKFSDDPDDIAEFYVKIILVSDNSESVTSNILKVDRYDSSLLPNYETFDGDTTDFASENDISQVTGAILHRTGLGKIEFFSQTLDFSLLDLDSYVFTENNLIGLDDAQLPGLDVISRITFYGMTHSNPIIFKDGVECGASCLLYSNSPGAITYTVSGFSNYSLGEDEYCGDGTCGSGENTCSCFADCGSLCSDGCVNGNEQCDDGNTNNNDGCSASCVIEYCGDGIWNDLGNEECDGSQDGDCPGLCLNDCLCGVVACGDGTCDSGDGEDTCSCFADCGSLCGDGCVNGNEQCDEGYTNPGDGCDENCMWESGEEGMLGMNINWVSDWVPQAMFVDVFKQSKVFEVSGYQCIDEHGFPTESPCGGIATTNLMTNGEWPAGSYTLQFSGTGSIRLTGRGLNGVTFQPGTHSVNLNKGNFLEVKFVTSAVSDPIRDVHIFLPGYANANEFDIYPGFVDKWKDYSPIRFMDLMSTNGNQIEYWDDRRKITEETFAFSVQGSRTARLGVPPEVIYMLGNSAQSDVWVNIPHKVDFSAPDNNNYVKQLAAMLAQNLNSNQKVWVEYSNEVWNPQFGQYGWANAAAVEKWGTNCPTGLCFHDYIAWASVQSWQAFIDELGDSRVVKVVPGSAGITWHSSKVIASVNNNEINPNQLKGDVLTLAPYFSINTNPSWTGDFVEAGCHEIADPVTVTLEMMQAQIDGNSPHTSFSSCPGYSDRRSSIAEYLPGQVALANANDMELVAYEGGQHLVASWNNSGIQSQLNSIFTEVNRDPRLEQLYVNYLNTWFGLGGGRFVHFNNEGEPTKDGYWGLLEWEWQNPDGSGGDPFAPKWFAVQNYL
jgi:cysteine-rich repeat protein